MDAFERNAIKNEIGTRDLPSIFQAMQNAGRVEDDGMKQLSLQIPLLAALRREPPNPEFLEQMRLFVTDGSNPKFERDLVLGALGGAATKETVDLLLLIATTSSDQKLRDAAAGLAGGGGLPGGDREKLSPSLERAWRESSDRNLLNSVAASMAEIGTPSGIELLLSAALAPVERDKVREAAARYALEKIYSPIAVPALEARLGGQSATSEAAKLIAPIIVRIGDATAGKAVVSWLQNRDENAAPLIRDLVVQQMRSDQMRSAWKAALDPAVPFRNEQNREAIRASLVLRSP
jgi:HEAT repeat protein